MIKQQTSFQLINIYGYNISGADAELSEGGRGGGEWNCLVHESQKRTK